MVGPDLELELAGSSIKKESPLVFNREEYEKNLEGLRRMSFINDSLQTLSWFLGFCALTWASAVILGAYVSQLVKKDYYEVFLLLVVEGIRFGLVALYRSLGSYRLGPFLRWLFRSAEFALPLGMGSFALFSLLPINYNFFGHHHSSSSIHSTSFITRINAQTSSTPSPLPYDSLNASLHIFYACILFNALVLIFRSIFNSLMRIIYMIPLSKSLRKYHDKMLGGGGSDTWMRIGVDLDFAFTMQSYDYRKGSVSPIEMCETYGDLVWFLYFHERGFEVAEKVIAGEDVYMQEAAANMVGFWVVLETLEAVKGKRTPLRLQKGMLRKLADIAAETYGPVGIAAARTIALLLKWSYPLGNFTSSEYQRLATITLERLIHSSSEPYSLQEDTSTLIHALRESLLHLDDAELINNIQQALHVQEHNSEIIKNHVYNDIRSKLLAVTSQAQRKRRHLIVKVFMEDMTIPLFSFFIGFVSYALISHL